MRAFARPTHLRAPRDFLLQVLRHPRSFLLIIIFISIVSCRPLSTGRNWLAAVFPDPTPLPPSSTATAFPVATSTPTAFPFSTSTPTVYRSPTLAPSPIATTTPSPQTVVSSAQLEIFEELWEIVDQEYIYPDLNGVDWDQVYVEYREKILAGLSDEEFYVAMDQMIEGLGDEHSVFLRPDQVTLEDAEFAGESEFIGIGVMIVPQPKGEGAVVLLTFPDGSAEQAGVRPRDVILTADGNPIVGSEGSLRGVLSGPEGTSVRLVVQSPGEGPRVVTVFRKRLSGSTPVPYQVFISPAGKRIGYVLLVSFADITIPQKVEAALQSMTADGPLDGLILDNRWNHGGTSTAVRQTLSLFTRGVVGQFVNREVPRPFLVRASDVMGSQLIPMVILVGSDTISFGEIFAGILQDLDRASLIGEATRGNVEILRGYEFADGSRAWIAHDEFVPLNGGDVNWEGNGVIPDLQISTDLGAYPVEADPVILAAMQHLDR